MKTVITYGTFDLFHVGHVRLLKRLSELGDRLIVGISSDEFNELKGKKSFFSYEERAEIVLSSKYVDFVFPENSWEQKREDIIKYNAHLFAMGDDWTGKFDTLMDVCDVIYLPRTEDISTTKIKRNLSSLKTSEIDKIEESLLSVINMVRSISF
ncbi:adenylyltransferase/cytidyltransferase family protein [Vibrio cholerae]|uniref:adenylyltransferase/cytidyltransferase family protein n=1 Tax=Vibrio cholerae TaxID=666 RepID=UPI001C2F5C5E|nr:adenylyltransferase/cytidyltransferase family protein [Vibrio cholerae]EGR4192202.1 glycerol-3-phosphate cytidylyltransferase [Vibrio cholerae]